jgi:peptidase E
MDARLLELAGGPVAVVPLASGPGTDYRRTHDHGGRHFRALGAEVLPVPDPRRYDAGQVLSRARVMVLPGGSPSRLRDALASTGLVPVLRQLLADDGAVMGASAGAMLLGERTVLPEEGLRLVAATGLVPGVAVVPHWTGARDDWLAVLGDGTVLGLPEESGVLVRDGTVTAVGRHPTRLVREGTDLSVGATLRLP